MELTKPCPFLLTFVDSCNLGIDLKLLENTETEDAMDRLTHAISFAQLHFQTLLKQLIDLTDEVFEEVKACEYTLTRQRYFDACAAACNAMTAVNQFIRELTSDTLEYDAFNDLGKYVAVIGLAAVECRALSREDLRRNVELFVSIEVAGMRADKKGPKN